jgi:hypothetical protein
MYLGDSISQAQRAEVLRRQPSRGHELFSTNEDNNAHEDVPIDRPASSLRNLFSRTMSFKTRTAATRNGPSIMLQDPSSQLSIPQQDSMRSLSLSSTSRGNPSPAMDSNRSSISRASWDPPPLFQAYPQALKYALLDSPSTSVESILRNSGHQNNATSGGSTTPTNLKEASMPQKKTKKHKRHISMSSWTRKLYILVRNGYILQYSSNCQERLPEKILQLGPHSVAFASDAIPGRPYVLQISRDPNQEAEYTDVHPKNIWSRIGFRTTEEKRMASTFLLVCDSSDELDAWMVAVRREIDSHGGAQYRCGTPRAEYDQLASFQELQQQDDHCEDTGQALQRPQTDITHLERPTTGKYEPLPKIKTLSALWLDQPLLQTRRSSANSSVGTATELDGLRGSSQSGTSTALSLDESTPSLSPADDKFSEASTALPANNQHSFLQIKQQTSLIPEISSCLPRQRSLSPKQIPPSSFEKHRLGLHDAENRPVSIVPNFSLPNPNLSRRYSRCSLVHSDGSSPAMSEIWDMVTPERIPTDNPATEIMSKWPTSTIAPLPPREAIVQKAWSRISSIEQTRPRTSAPSITLASSPSQMGRHGWVDIKPSLYSPTSTYTLFSKRYSLDVQNRSSASPSPEVDPLEIRVSAFHKRSSSTPRLNESTNLLRVPQGLRLRRPASMQIESRSSLETERPERSPAVTDMHFATNFGTADPFNRSSSRSSSGSSSSSMTEDTLMSSVPPLELVSANLQESGRPSRRKAASASVLGPPVGPPPTCPLPEPPSISSLSRGLSVPAGPSPRRLYLDLTTDNF